MVLYILMAQIWPGWKLCKFRSNSWSCACDGAGLSRVGFHLYYSGTWYVTADEIRVQMSRIDLFRVLHKSLRRVRNGYAVTENSGLDVWAYHSYGKSLYEPIIYIFSFTQWRGLIRVYMDFLIFESSILRLDFQFHKQSRSIEYVNYINWERLSRYRTGFLFP